MTKRIALLLIPGLLIAFGATTAACGDDGSDSTRPTATVDVGEGDGEDTDPTATTSAGEPTTEPVDGPSTELEEYFERLDVAEDTFHAEGDQTDAELSALDETTIDQAGEIILAGQDSIDSFVETLESLDPPEEVSEAHAETVAGFKAASAWIDDNIAAFESAASLDDINAIFSSSEYQSISASLEGTCTALQAIADGNGIVVDLSCDN